ncbi:MAG: MFS transporter, partial [Candidatus Rokubacteria bacterium]|nr:MFS transporter [Candidatus Rokubacteria bacterium]
MLPIPPRRREQYLTLGAVATGYFSVQLALTPISAILPSLARALNADLPTASWIVIGYLLSLSAFLLLAGRLGDLMGHRALFLGGLVLFTVASVLCGQAQSASQMILFRTLQGLGAAFVTANSLALIAGVFPAGERGRAVGVVIMSTGFGSFVGIGLGAFFLRYLSWSWAFYFIGLTGAIAIALTLRVRQSREAVGVPVDWIGAGGLFLAMLTLFLGMNHFHGAGNDEGYHVSFLGAFILLAAGLAWIERRRAHPLIEFRHFAHLPFTASVIANGIVHMTMMGVIFLVPFLVEQVLGLSPFDSAITLALS